MEWLIPAILAGVAVLDSEFSAHSPIHGQIRAYLKSRVFGPGIGLSPDPRTWALRPMHSCDWGAYGAIGLAAHP